MRNKLKVLENYAEKNESPISAQFILPNGWWNSCLTFGAEERTCRLDLIQFQTEKISAPGFRTSTEWQIDQGDYEMKLSADQLDMVTCHDERVKKERIYLSIGVIVVVFVVTLFSFLASSIGNFN